MNSPQPEWGRLKVLGCEHGAWGSVASTWVGSHAAAAISVGSDRDSPSSQFKFDPEVNNEDAGCVISTPDWVGLAVADAHYGPESSHQLIERLHRAWANIRPTDPSHLSEMIELLRQGEPATTESETTLLAVSYDRESGTGFGVSFGDSSFVVAGPSRPAELVNPHDGRYVNTFSPGALRHGSVFQFDASPGDLLLAYTDGVDNCHYRNPQTSVQISDIDHLARDVGYVALQAAEQLTRLALRGVRGNPGGQDNIVVLAAHA